MVGWDLYPARTSEISTTFRHLASPIYLALRFVREWGALVKWLRECNHPHPTSKESESGEESTSGLHFTSSDASSTEMVGVAHASLSQSHHYTACMPGPSIRAHPTHLSVWGDVKWPQVRSSTILDPAIPSELVFTHRAGVGSPQHRRLALTLHSVRKHSRRAPKDNARPPLRPTRLISPLPAAACGFWRRLLLLCY